MLNLETKQELVLFVNAPYLLSSTNNETNMRVHIVVESISPCRLIPNISLWIFYCLSFSLPPLKSPLPSSLFSSQIQLTLYLLIKV